MRIAVAGGTGVVGRHVVDVARERGHEVVILSRGNGVDLLADTGVVEALSGADVAIDVVGAPSVEEGPATEFFEAVARSLAAGAEAARVSRVVTLSIVGIDGVDFGYYAAKRAHERAASAGAVPATILRATQFHEFPIQQIGWTSDGETASVFAKRAQTIAARTVAEALVDTAEAEYVPRAVDIAGPEVANLVDLARRYVVSRGESLEIVPWDAMAALADDALLPGPGARRLGPTFDEWLATAQVASVG